MTARTLVTGSILSLTIAACGTPTYSVPKVELLPVANPVKAMQVELTEFIVGEEWSWYKYRGMEFGRQIWDRYTVRGSGEASWALARALEDQGFAVESERLGEPADVRLTVYFERPREVQGPTGLASRILVVVSDAQGKVLVDHRPTLPVKGTDLWDASRRDLFDARPNHIVYATIALPEVVDALSKAADALAARRGAHPTSRPPTSSRARSASRGRGRVAAVSPVRIGR